MCCIALFSGYMEFLGFSRLAMKLFQISDLKSRITFTVTTVTVDWVLVYSFLFITWGLIFKLSIV